MEEAVSAEPGSRNTCCAGEHKGWRVVAKRKVPGDKVRKVGGGQVMQGLMGHGKESGFFPRLF